MRKSRGTLSRNLRIAPTATVYIINAVKILRTKKAKLEYTEVHGPLYKLKHVVNKLTMV